MVIMLLKTFVEKTIPVYSIKFMFIYSYITFNGFITT